jgi:ABC-type nitrate/sulfonate/bicarbonate transport system substrate-binding protein
MKITKKLQKALLAMIFLVSICLVISMLASRPVLKSQPIRVAYTPVTTCLPFFVAHKKGYFGEQEMELRLVQSSQEAMIMLLSKEVDIVIQQNMSVVFSAWLNAKDHFLCFMPAIETPDRSFDYILVRKDSNITSVKDLKGKAIGFRRSATDRLLAKLYLDVHKLRLGEDVKPEEFDAPLLSSKLISKNIDVAFTVDPDATIALNKFPNEIIVLKKFYRGDFCNPYPATCNAVSTDFYQQRSGEFKVITKGLKLAIQDIEQKREESMSIMADSKYTLIKDADIAKQVGVPLFANDYLEYAKDIQKTIDIYVNGKVLKQAVELDKVFISTK